MNTSREPRPTSEITLCDHADGVAGHFCLGRISPKLGAPYWEYYFKGEWCSAGELFTKEEAETMKRKLDIEEHRDFVRFAKIREGLNSGG